mmetsp:Transcript_17081/g.24000  ORF Transcript_17081/g.24000 Transcript_17081/m.24000 type:complete len:93 (-) Transcript_17081:50-328(-)
MIGSLFGYKVHEKVLRPNRDIFVLANWSGSETTYAKPAFTKEQPFVFRLGSPEAYVENQEYWARNCKVFSGLLVTAAIVLNIPLKTEDERRK